MDPAPVPSSGPTRTNRGLWVLVALMLAVWVGVLMYGRGGGGVLPAPSLGTVAGMGEAPKDWRLLTLEGKPVELGAYRGKTVFLNLWATWCPPCVQELPSIEELASNADLRKKGVVVLAVATGGEDNETVRRFVNDRGYESIAFFRAEDLPAVFQTPGIPATFMIGPDGRIAGSQIGSADWNTPEVVAFLEKLAAGPARPIN